MKFQCPHCKTILQLKKNVEIAQGKCPKCGNMIVYRKNEPYLQSGISQPPTDPLIDKQFRNFKIIGKIGSGGMADVYMGYQLNLERYIAVKILPLQLARQKDFVERLQREARSAAKLNHPNIITIHDVGFEDSYYYVAMELVDGLSVGQYIKKYGKYELMEGLRIILDVAGALDYAHNAGIIHRDIKPDNILLDVNHRTVVTDFGLAKAKSDIQITHPTESIGTPRYMSPEQLQGGQVDARSDLYSLGVTAFIMLSGSLPFEAGDPFAIAMKHVKEEPPLITTKSPDIPKPVEEMIDKLLRKNPDERYQSGDELCIDLERFLGTLQLNNNMTHISEQAVIPQRKYEKNMEPLPDKKKAAIPSDESRQLVPLPAATSDDIQELDQVATTQKMSRRGNLPVLAWLIPIIIVIIVIIAVFTMRQSDKPEIARENLIRHTPVTAKQSTPLLMVDSPAETLTTPSPVLETVYSDPAGINPLQKDSDSPVPTPAGSQTAVFPELFTPTAGAQITGSPDISPVPSEKPVYSLSETQIKEFGTYIETMIAVLSKNDGSRYAKLVNQLKQYQQFLDNSTGLSKTEVERILEAYIQFVLKNKFQYKISIDGYLGNETINALKDFYTTYGAGINYNVPSKISFDDLQRVINDLQITGVQPTATPEFRPYIERFARIPAEQRVTELPGKSFTEKVEGLKLKMIWIEGGTFLMGTGENLEYGNQNEMPAREIQVSGFWISESEITNDQYEDLIEDETRKNQQIENRKVKDYDKNDPVVYLSWYMAMDFCYRLSGLTGKKYSLPTEAQWEYAVRAGTSTKYFFGDDETELEKYVWFGDNSNQKLQKVKKRRENPWNLFDMLGSVQEWCWDWYNPEYYRNLNNGAKNPAGPRSGTKKTIRGGDIFSPPSRVRCAIRDGIGPDQSSNYIGFRIVLLPW